jgi:hypothetical protein
MPSLYQTCYKDDINVSLGLVTFARWPQALAIDRLKPGTHRKLALDRAAVLTGHFHRLALRGDILTQLTIHRRPQLHRLILIHRNPCHALDRIAAQRV